MAKTRGEVSEVAMQALMSHDQLKAQVGFSHPDIIYAVAAGLAQMPEEDRAHFREAFDQIEEEMQGSSRQQ